MRIIAFLLCTAAVFAQSGGSISGTVLNLPGEVVANAPIQATNVTTNAVYKTTSSDKGLYTITQLPPGAYDISVAFLGYNPFVQKNVTVASAQTARLDIHLIDYQFDTLGDGREFRIDLYSPHPAPRVQRRGLRKANRISPESGTRRDP